MRIGRYVNGSGRAASAIGLDSGTWVEARQVEPWRWEPTDRQIEVQRWLPPIEPVDIWAVGKNYAEHAREFGSSLPENPILFMKPTSSVIGEQEPIIIPAACDRGPEVDYEVELAVIIGPNPVRDISEDQALNYVFGYTVANDITARRWQKHGGAEQWVRGKSFDTFCPIGPIMVTAADIPDPQALAVRTRLNGNLMQDGHTSEMIFSVSKLIAFISRDTTLKPGSVILTGTPSGVGFARKPPVFLSPGDEVEV
ncbi:MAG: fumarylacetoacetate hydrolase family protein [Phycisphaeraceae bacterium]|nr:fumarylacetoacetate hydrolase family protein [Phycisphaeraceae bacterium]